MARVPIGAEPWGELLNADISGVESRANDAYTLAGQANTLAGQADTKANANTIEVAKRIPLALFDTKGDLLVGSGPDTAVQLPASATRGAVLLTDPLAPSGLSWKAQPELIRNLLPAPKPGYGTWVNLDSATGALSGAQSYTPDYPASPGDTLASIIRLQNVSASPVTVTARASTTVNGSFAGALTPVLGLPNGAGVVIPAGATVDVHSINTLGPTATGFRTFVQATSGSQTSLRLIQAITAKSKTLLTGYFDGDSPGAHWAGAHGASHSVKTAPFAEDLVPPTSPLEFVGTGSPEGVVEAPIGARYTDTAGTNGAIHWVKTSNTALAGWKCSYGDTGWRSVAVWDSSGNLTKGTLPAGWKPRAGGGYVHVRRQNNRCYIALNNIAVAVASTTDRIWNGTGLGFGPNNGATVTMVSSFSPTHVAQITGLAATLVRGSNYSLVVDSYILGAFIQYLTDEDWPTTLW